MKNRWKNWTKYSIEWSFKDRISMHKDKIVQVHNNDDALRRLLIMIRVKNEYKRVKDYNPKAWKERRVKMITCNCSASERDRICLFAGRALPKSINIARGDCPCLCVRRTLPGLTSLCAYEGSRLCMCFSPAQSCSSIFHKCMGTIHLMLIEVWY